MNISGALGLLGGDTLESVAWGETIMSICNIHLPDTEQITITDTGDQVMVKVFKLEQGIQYKLLSAKISNESFNGLTGINLKLASNLIALSMAVIGTVITMVYRADEGGETANSIINTFIKVLEAVIGVMNQ